MSQITLILLPGLDGTGDLFQALLRVIPSHLQTTVIHYPHDRFLAYDDLLRLVGDQLPKQGEMVLIAESFSGPLALRYAAMYPGRVLAVVLCASFICPPLPRWFRFLARPLALRLPLPGFAVRKLLVGPSATTELVEAVKDAIRKVPPHVLAGRVREVLDVNCTEALRKCTAPILYLAASHDVLVRRSSADAIRAIRPDVQVRTIEGPHLILQREPAAAWREIESYVSQFISAP